MALVKVNLTLEKAVWKMFSNIVPNRKKSGIINELLKRETRRIQREQEKAELAAGFQEASRDSERQEAIKEWDFLDHEGWE